MHFSEKPKKLITNNREALQISKIFRNFKTMKIKIIKNLYNKLK